MCVPNRRFLAETLAALIVSLMLAVPHLASAQANANRADGKAYVRPGYTVAYPMYVYPGACLAYGACGGIWWADRRPVRRPVAPVQPEFVEQDIWGTTAVPGAMSAACRYPPPRAISSRATETPALSDLSSPIAAMARRRTEHRRNDLEVQPVARPPLDNHGSSARRHHEHPVSLAKHLVVQVHPDHRVATCFLRALLKLSQRDVPGSLQLTLIGGRPSANKVADAGEQVLEEIGAKNRFSGDDSAVLVMRLPSMLGVVVTCTCFSDTGIGPATIAYRGRPTYDPATGSRYGHVQPTKARVRHSVLGLGAVVGLP